MDYNFVQEILRELTVHLRNSLNPADTLPFMYPHFTHGEVQKVKCKLQNYGEGPANDELLYYVRTKPHSFVAVLASLEENRNADLFKIVWRHIITSLTKTGRRQDVHVLRQEVTAYKQHLLQTGLIAAGDNRAILAHRLPMEILRMDKKSVEIFKKALEDGKERDYNIRILVVGPPGVGKTTLTKRLLCLNVDIDEQNSTDGIDVHVGKCKVSLKTLDWTVDPAVSDTTDDNVFKRLAEILGSTRKADMDESTKISSTVLSYPDFIDSAVCVDDGDTINSPLEQEDLLLKDLKEVVAAGDTYEADDNAIISIWDFGGQSVFYTTHQMFLSHRAIYILVNDLSQHLNDLVMDDEPCFDCSGTESLKMEEYIDIWLNSIHGHSKNERADEPPVLLVGTHADDQKEENIEAMFDAIRNRFAKKAAGQHFTDQDFALNNAIEDSKLNDLRRKIMEVAKNQSHWGELKPAKWIPFERLLDDKRKRGVEIISRTEMEELNSQMAVPISSEEELDLFLRFQHEIASIMYFSLPELRNKIVLSPRFLVNALKSLITDEKFCKKRPEVLDCWREFRQKGLLKPNLLDAVWKNKSENTRFEENRTHILALMEHLNVIARPITYVENQEDGDCNSTQEQDHFLVPCMLKERPPHSIFQAEGAFISTPCLCLMLDNVAFPSSIFNRLLAACISRWPVAKRGKKYLIYCGCGQFDIDLQHRLTLSFSSNIIGLRIDRYCETERNPSSAVCKDVYSLVQQILRRIGDGLSLELNYREYVKCPFGRPDSFECLHSVEKMRGCDEFPCYDHVHVEILHSCCLLKYWFDAEEFNQISSPVVVYRRAQLAIGAPATPGLTAPDTELSKIKGKTMRNLGKELAKKDEEGTLRWEAVLDDLDVYLTFEQEDIIRNDDSPGLKFLTVLGREKITVRQLSEALQQCELDALNDILFERSGKPPESEAKHVDSLTKTEIPGVSLPPIQPSSLCARPDQNNFQDMELSKLKGKTMRILGEQLAKKGDGGTLRWEAVLDELGVELTMEKEEIIRNYDNPGLKFLNVLGREKIKVRQLSEALRECKLDALNDILFERSENVENQNVVEKITNGFENINVLSPSTSRETFDDTRTSANTDDSSRRDGVSASGRGPNQSPVNNSGTGNLPRTVSDPLQSASPSYYASQRAGRNGRGHDAFTRSRRFFSRSTTK